MIKRQIILASKSPRRKELLKQVKIPFKTHISTFLETNDLPKNLSLQKIHVSSGKCEFGTTKKLFYITPREYVLKNASGKAANVAAHYKNAIIIAADTIGFYKNRILEKPTNFEEAKAMLKSLSGHVHEVYTGLCLIDTRSGQELKEIDCTKVFFDKLTDSQIEDYLKKEEYLDKAGAFAIQGVAAFFIRRIEGSYSSVMGLPLHLLRKMLEQLGMA